MNANEKAEEVKARLGIKEVYKPIMSFQRT